MIYQEKEIEILSRKSVFGQQITEAKILYSGEIIAVPFSELLYVQKLPASSEIVFKAIAVKIKGENFNQSMLAPLEHNIIPLPHQILALEKVMSGHSYVL